MEKQVEECDVSKSDYPFIDNIYRYVKNPDERPEILYQYTDISGLIGIIESKKIWATDFRYLNDSSEINYGTSLVQSTLKKTLTNSDEYIKHFINEFLALGDDFFSLENIYVACFCTNGDLLSQWRGYGNNGEGYSIGFNTFHTDFSINREHSNCTTFLKVIYSKSEQEKIINDILMNYINYMQKEQITITRHMFKQYIKSFSECISRIICFFKHQSFLEEDEWRIISFTDKKSTMNNNEKPNDMNLLNFRKNKEFLIPYIEINLADKDSKNTSLPIAYIISGPSRHQELKKISLKQFMDKLGYDHLDNIIDSIIPFRN